jgi:hypothetical protein
MAAPSQITVLNEGSPITVGGISLRTGSNPLNSATLRLMYALGLFNSVRTPGLYVDTTGVPGVSPEGLVLTFSASGTVA